MGFLDFFNSKEEKVNIEESIKTEIDFSNFELISQYIYKKSGIIDLDKRALVFTRLKQFAQDIGVLDTSSFLNKMKNEENFYQKVINIVTVNETYFMREYHELEWLVKYVKSIDRKVKILSLPSSSGEETYSILIMLELAGIDMNKIEIKGYDINSEAVSDAYSGYYNTHSLHKVDSDIKDKYFMKDTSSLYQIKEEFRNKAKFEQKNIFELNNENEKYDIVLSRNMFIYFDMKKRVEAVNVIVSLLKKDGIYI